MGILGDLPPSPARPSSQASVVPTVAPTAQQSNNGLNHGPSELQLATSAMNGDSSGVSVNNAAAHLLSPRSSLVRTTPVPRSSVEPSNLNSVPPAMVHEQHPPQPNASSSSLAWQQWQQMQRSAMSAHLNAMQFNGRVPPQVVAAQLANRARSNAFGGAQMPYGMPPGMSDLWLQQQQQQQQQQRLWQLQNMFMGYPTPRPMGQMDGDMGMVHSMQGMQPRPNLPIQMQMAHQLQQQQQFHQQQLEQQQKQQQHQLEMQKSQVQQQQQVQDQAQLAKPGLGSTPQADTSAVKSADLAAVTSPPKAAAPARVPNGFSIPPSPMGGSKSLMSPPPQVEEPVNLKVGRNAVCCSLLVLSL